MGLTSAVSTDQLEDILAAFGALTSSWDENTPLDTMRQDFEGFFAAYPEAPGATIEHINLGAPCERTTTAGSDPSRAVLLLHGGGFSMGSARAHRPYATQLAVATDAVIYNLDYRLAPEHVFPAALDDVLAAYQSLLADPAINHIALCGDSAGGGLAVAAMLRMQAENLPSPAACVLVSPWADMLCEGASYDSNAALDPIASKDNGIVMGQTYLGLEGDPTDVLASPVRADLAGMPPTLILAGSREVFLDDGQTIADKIKQTGGSAEMQIWPGMIHQWPLHGGRLGEADEAVSTIGAFLSRHWSH